MPSVNKVFLMGHLGQDAEKKFLPNGSLVAKFSLATTNKYKQNDEWKETTDWHNIVIFGDRAEYAGEFRKGELVWLEGSISTRSWTKEDGSKAYMTEIKATSLKRISKKEDGSEEYYGGEPEWKKNEKKSQADEPKTEEEDESVDEVESLEDMGL